MNHYQIGEKLYNRFDLGDGFGAYTVTEKPGLYAVYFYANRKLIAFSRYDLAKIRPTKYNTPLYAVSLLREKVFMSGKVFK